MKTPGPQPRRARGPSGPRPPNRRAATLKPDASVLPAALPSRVRGAAVERHHRPLGLVEQIEAVADLARSGLLAVTEDQQPFDHGLHRLDDVLGDEILAVALAVHAPLGEDEL